MRLKSRLKPEGPGGSLILSVSRCRRRDKLKSNICPIDLSGVALVSSLSIAHQLVIWAIGTLTTAGRPKVSLMGGHRCKNNIINLSMSSKS